VSYEVSNSTSSLGQFASNQGYSNLARYILAHRDTYPSLTHLIQSGATKAVDDCITELEILAESCSNKTTAGTATILAKLIQGQSVIAITDGDEQPSTDDSYSSMPVSPGLTGLTGLSLDLHRITTQLDLSKVLRNPGHLRNLLRDFASSQRDKLVSTLETIGPMPSKSEALAAIDDLDWSPLPDKIQPHLRDMAIRGGLEALESMDDDSIAGKKDVFNRSVEVSRSRAASIVGMRYYRGKLVQNPDAEFAINVTASKELSEIVNKAFAEGDQANLGKLLAEAKCWSPSRLNTTADTETARAKHEGKVEGFRSSGVEKVEWRLSKRYHSGKSKGESKPCLCPTLAKNSPYDIDDVPDLPHPNCDCTIGPISQ